MGPWDTFDTYKPDLRPGNRGIGVSVAVDTHFAYWGFVARIVIRRLVAWDGAAQADMALEPGVFIESCRIHRDSETGDQDLGGYVMAFESGGRELRCPLVQFQARTEALQPAGVNEIPARERATS